MRRVLVVGMLLSCCWANTCAGVLLTVDNEWADLGPVTVIILGDNTDSYGAYVEFLGFETGLFDLRALPAAGGNAVVENLANLGYPNIWYIHTVMGLDQPIQVGAQFVGEYVSLANYGNVGVFTLYNEAWEVVQDPATVTTDCLFPSIRLGFNGDTKGKVYEMQVGETAKITGTPAYAYDQGVRFTSSDPALGEWTITATREEYCIDYTATAPGEVTLAFTFNDQCPFFDGGLYNLDEITIVQVPEPGSVLLLGLGGIGILRRRRRVSR